MRNLSLRGLSEATGKAVSHNALDRYEKGVMMPESENLIEIARALEQPLDFFFRPISARLEGIAFRKLAKLKGVEETAIRERAHAIAERLVELEELVGTTIAFKDPLEQTTVRTPEDAEAAARTLRSEWNLGQAAIPSVVGLLEDNGVKVAEVEADQSFSGLSGWSGNLPVIVLRATTAGSSLVRKRFTALHELAHLLLDKRIPPEIEGKPRENLMDCFAGSMLMPTEVLRREVGSSRTGLSVRELEKIKLAYGISIAALVRRAAQVGIVNARYYTFFQIKHKTQTWKTTGEPGDEHYRGHEECRRFEQLVWRALAEETISQSKAASFLGLKPAQLWHKLQVEA